MIVCMIMTLCMRMFVTAMRVIAVMVGVTVEAVMPPVSRLAGHHARVIAEDQRLDGHRDRK